MRYNTGFNSSTEYPNGFSQMADSVDTQEFRNSMESPDAISKRLKKQQDDDELEALLLAAGVTTAAFGGAAGLAANAARVAPYLGVLTAAASNPASQHYVQNIYARTAAQAIPTIGGFYALEKAHEQAKVGYDGNHYNTYMGRVLSDYTENPEQFYAQNAGRYGNLPKSAMNIGGMFATQHPAGMFLGDIMEEALTLGEIPQINNEKNLFSNLNK